MNAMCVKLGSCVVERCEKMEKAATMATSTTFAAFFRDHLYLVQSPCRKEGCKEKERTFTRKELPVLRNLFSCRFTQSVHLVKWPYLDP